MHSYYNVCCSKILNRDVTTTYVFYSTDSIGKNIRLHSAATD